MRVLVAEDDPLVRLSAAEYLCEEGFVVVEAGSGDEALQQFRQGQSIQALLTDIRMPGSIDGWELARHVRNIDPSVIVIYVTGYSDMPVSPVSGSMFFNKPYRMERIVEALRALRERPKISARSLSEAD